jgi:hypothetical protein
MQTWHTDILVPCAASECALGLPYVIRTWRPKRIVSRGRLAAHYGTDLAYGHPGALHSIDIRDGFAIRFSKMAPARDHPPRSLRFALRPRPGVRTYWCPAQHLNPQRACHAVRYAKMESARLHPLQSHGFALRCRSGVSTSWCAVQQPHLRSRLASHCGTDVGCGHPGALHRIHMRNALAPMVRARYHPPRSPRFALRHRPGVRTSWCPAHHPHPRLVCHTVFKNGARKGSPAAVASLRAAAQTWRTDIRVPCTPSTCAMGLPYGMPSWSPRGIIRCGRLASHCDADLAHGHPGTLRSI